MNGQHGRFVLWDEEASRYLERLYSEELNSIIPR